jgi:sarcosine oxidase
MRGADVADVAVIGLGAVGSAVLYQLAWRGVRVVGIDRYHPPHAMGSSHGETRISRLLVGEGDAYAPLVQRSHAIWQALEAESGEQLFLRTGGLIMAPRDGAAEHHGTSDFVRRTAAVADRAGVPYDLLDAHAIAQRFPQFQLRGDELGVFEPSAGMVFPERCVATQLRLAERHGATLRLDDPVEGVRRIPGGVEVETRTGRVTAARAVLTAGPWLPQIAGHAIARVAKVYRQTLHWFTPEDRGAYAPDRFPVFIWMHGDGPEDYFYGFPTAPGGRGVKVASERYASPTDPDSVDRVVTKTETAAIFARHVAGRLRGVTPDCLGTAACLYTVTPDAGFIVDALPGEGRVLAVSACSGHGFKHSAALGEAVAEQVAGGASRISLAPFALGRFAPAAI